MVSREQNNIRRPEEETVPPLDQKQPSRPASSWRGWNFWFRVLGVVVPLVGGFAFSFPNPLPLAVVVLEPILMGFVAAALLRSWWAMLIVPVGLSVGFFLGNIFQMGGLDLQSWAASGFEGVDIVVILGVVPIAIGVAIGTPLGKKIEQRLQ